MVKDEIEKIVEPVIKRHNCFLWGVEILRGRKRPTLRVYIDTDKVELILMTVRTSLKI